MDKEQIILTISILTSRKEEKVRRCLESLTRLRREISSELILVDTSEDPHMHEVLMEYTDHIIPFHWINDFSAARNAGLMEARGEWFLFLDDDEWLVEPDEIIGFFKSGAYKSYEGAAYIVRNFRNQEHTLWDDSWASRMVQRKPGIHFESPIHEYLVPVPEFSVALHSIVYHDGYVFLSQEQRLEHHERNCRLLRKMMDEHPEDVRWPVEMLMEYRSVEKNDELLELGRESLRRFSDMEDQDILNAVPSFYAAEMLAYEGLQELDHAYEVCGNALQDPRVGLLGRAFFHMKKGFYAFKNAHYQEAEQEEAEYLRLYDYFNTHEEEKINQSATAFIHRALSDENYKRAHSIWTKTSLRTKRDTVILTISVLTSRKEEQVRRCLESLVSLRREVPSELILVDTSEDPHMHEVLMEYTDHIIPFHWINDFSVARNAGLREAEGEWFLYLDDDEWFENCQEIIDFFKSGSYKRYNGAVYIQRNYTNHEGTQWNDLRVSRMAKMKQGIHFTSPIHEYLEPVADRVRSLHSYVHHYGYVGIYESNDRSRYDRDYSLIQGMIDKEPDNVRWRLQMIMLYGTYGETQKLFDLAEECLQYFDKSSDPSACNAFSAFYAAKLMLYDEWLRYDLAYQVCQKALQDPRVSKTGQAFFHNRRADYAMKRDNYQEAEQDECFYLGYYKQFCKDESEQLIQSSVPFIMNAYNESNMIMAYSILICAGLKQRNISYLKQYYSELKLEENPSYFYPMLPKNMVEAMVIMDSDKIFIRVLRGMNRNADIWQQLEYAILRYVSEHPEAFDKLVRVLEEGNIDTSFLTLYTLRDHISKPEKDLQGEKLTERLQEYVNISVSYYEKLFEGQEGSYEENEDKYPADYRAAVLLQRIFEEKDLQKRISLLRDVVETYPPLSEAVKRYAAYLGEQIAAQPSRQSVDPELVKMVQQILPNVQTLTDNGLYKEAYEVAKQLRVMIPDDRELMELEESIMQRWQGMGDE